MTSLSVGSRWSEYKSTSCCANTVVYSSHTSPAPEENSHPTNCSVHENLSPSRLHHVCASDTHQPSPSPPQIDPRMNTSGFQCALKVTIHDCPHNVALDEAIAEVFSMYNPLRIHGRSDSEKDRTNNVVVRYIELQEAAVAIQAMHDLNRKWMYDGSCRLEITMFPSLPAGFTFQRCLQDGEHCMSIVVEALDETGGRVVLKRTTSDNNQKYIERELAILKQCDGHPHIVQLVEKELVGGWLVIECMGGGSFDAECEVPQNLTHREVLQIAAATGEALSFLHSKNIIHRDVKPHNIFFERDEYNEIVTIKLADMGLATTSPEARFAGTKNYAAPETFRDRAVPTSDMWSWGSTIAHLATGVKPFEGDNKNIPYSQELRDVELPEGLHELLTCCFNQDPLQRPSAEAAHRSSCEWLEALPTEDDVDQPTRDLKSFDFAREKEQRSDGGNNISA